jgi:uncharacterized protein (DUF885 family)
MAFRKAGFEPISLRSGGVGSNAGSAANAVSVGDTFGTIRDSSPKFGDIADTAMQVASMEKMAAEKNATDLEISENNLEATEAEAGAAKSAGGMAALGQVAGAAIGLMSDEETKHTVDTIDDALETLRNLRPVTFFYKEEYSSSPERMHHGFIAQEFQEVVPDATYYDESIGKLCIDTTDLIGLLVRANQQLETRLARLEAKQALAAV